MLGAALSITVVLLAGSPEAAILDDELFCGALTFEGDVIGLAAESYIEAPPAEVVKALTDWDGLGELMPMTKVHEVRERRPDGARIFREMDTPFFMPDAWVLIDTHVETGATGTHITLKRKDGTPKQFEATWRIEAAGATGTRLVYTARLEPPFHPPHFMLKRVQKKNIAQMLTALRTRVKATSVKAPHKCR